MLTFSLGKNASIPGRWDAKVDENTDVSENADADEPEVSRWGG